MKFYTDDDVRQELLRRVEGRTQADICRELEIKPQNLSIQLAGSPIIGKVLSWLGYTRVVRYVKTGSAEGFGRSSK